MLEKSIPIAKLATTQTEEIPATLVLTNPSSASIPRPESPLQPVQAEDAPTPKAISSPTPEPSIQVAELKIAQNDAAQTPVAVSELVPVTLVAPTPQPEPEQLLTPTIPTSLLPKKAKSKKAKITKKEAASPSDTPKNQPPIAVSQTSQKS